MACACVNQPVSGATTHAYTCTRVTELVGDASCIAYVSWCATKLRRNIWAFFLACHVSFRYKWGPVAPTGAYLSGGAPPEGMAR